LVRGLWRAGLWPCCLVADWLADATYKLHERVIDSDSQRSQLQSSRLRFKNIQQYQMNGTKIVSEESRAPPLAGRKFDIRQGGDEAILPDRIAKGSQGGHSYLTIYPPASAPAAQELPIAS